MKRRRQYSAEWKARVALEAVKGQRTVQQIASHYEVHPSLVVQWKRRLLEVERPIFHHLKNRTQTHIFLCVLACRLLAAIEHRFLQAGFTPPGGPFANNSALIRW